MISASVGDWAGANGLAPGSSVRTALFSRAGDKIFSDMAEAVEQCRGERSLSKKHHRRSLA